MENQKWFLMKHEDGTVFGPVDFPQLRQWALDAQISPLDKVSTDESSWSKAPMIPELGMDYIVEVSPDQYYGPTTLSALREFLELGEISGENIVTNCKDGSERRVDEIEELKPPAEKPEEEKGVRTTIRQSMQQRIRDLEETLLEERRAREAAERLVQRLENRVSELESRR